MSRISFIAIQSLKNAVSVRGLTALLSTFGALWLFVEITDFFAKDSSTIAWVHGHGWVFFTSGVAIALWVCRPKTKVSCRLKTRDVTITLAIGDIFSMEGAIVVGSNSTFDVSSKVINEKSVQGQFTKKYYAGEDQLETELNEQLRGLDCEDLEAGRIGKCKRYAIGSVARLHPKGRTGYMLAIADMNPHRNSSGTFEKLKEALSALWVFLGEKGAKEPLLVPVLGSGFTRLAQPRQTIVQEIIKSFVAACAEKAFCENLTIVLSDRDVFEKEIDFVALGEYLKHVCHYTELSYRGGERVGTAEA